MKAIVCIAVLLLGFLVLQCWNPHIDHPAVTGKIQAPPAVTAILERACFDCHSNENRIHWYDEIAPASWLVNADIKEARSRFNLSTWDSLKPADQQGLLWEMVNMIINGKMPLGVYTAMHRSARVTPQEVEVLKHYLVSLDRYKVGDTALAGAADREFADFAGRDSAVWWRAMGAWAGSGSGASSTGSGSASTGSAYPGLMAADGVRYIDSFANWQVVSTTNRFDNHSIRVIYGNALAVEAIRSGHVASFPDGTTFVKAVWNSIEDASGHVRPGTVNSIQIMTKDEKRFPDTKGWGFAKFNGVRLIPYGTHASFNTTCYNCHTMAKDFGYVFNIPPTRELFDAGGLRVITSFADGGQQTMSTLYGNEVARFCALKGALVASRHASGNSSVISAGGIYTLATWREVKNTFWFGSRINGPLLCVERVTITPDSKVAYEVVKGSVPADGSGHVPGQQARIDLILAQRPSVFP